MSIEFFEWLIDEYYKQWKKLREIEEDDEE